MDLLQHLSYFYNFMPRLSTYSNYDYPEGEEQVMPWEFWTDEQRSLVIKEGYKDLVLTSTEVKPYLNASRIHFYTQWLVPIIAAGVCYGPLRVSLLAHSYRRHPHIGFRSRNKIIQIVRCCLEASLLLGLTLALSTSKSKVNKFEH